MTTDQSVDDAWPGPPALSLANMRGAPLEPCDQVILHWHALGAPLQRIARAAHLPAALVHERLAWLTARGFVATTRTRSRVPWSARSATTLVRGRLAAPDHEQLVFVAGEGVLTVADMNDLIGRFCLALDGLGVRPGDAIAVDGAPRLASLLAMAAGMAYGAIVVRLSENVPAATLRAMLELTDPRITFSNRFALIGEWAATGVRVSIGAEGAELSLEALLAEQATPAVDHLHRLATAAPDAIASIGFTSGSTGAPKTVAIGHETIYRGAEIAANLYTFDPTDTFCTPTDITSISAFRSFLSLPFLTGARVLIPDDQARSSPVALAMLCERYRVTRLCIIPSVIRSLNKAGNAVVRRGALASLRHVFCGSGQIDTASVREFHHRFGVPIADHYGCAELTGIAYVEPSDSVTLGSGGGRIEEVLAVIVDDHGDPAPHGEPGEIVAHGECITSSDLPSIPRDGRWAGWHFTGDLGRYLPNGRLEIVGRKRDVVKTPDGALVSPAAIESVLTALPWVEDAAAFSWLDRDDIERVAAAVTIASGHAGGDIEARAREAQAAVRSALGEFKMPARVMVLESMPRVARGKPDKPRLRGMLSEGWPPSGRAAISPSAG